MVQGGAGRSAGLKHRLDCPPTQGGTAPDRAREVAQTGKFGTFGGVFTPSILTILGVIMYLRLPWIVGQAGLWMTLGIITVAHVISVTTGLSVSSIATDKRVRVGGNYYLISRSLGLSIGGTLGIALFVGLSFSVSLYIIGFVESFLPTVGIAVTKTAVRLYGTGAMLAVAAIVVISTSLAIRAQYLIMAAVALSLISVFLGSPATAPSAPALERLAGGQPLMVLFGIFFPAVTGFTAGVQMSGDLRDSRRSIPLGTMLAIAVGLVAYMGLATFLAYRADGATLAGNANVLQDMAWVPQLLYPGIWGATLSSAMGSLLGAPRILQATSIDRITPRLFARGHGPKNEPRNALILVLVIAEAGILLGELNLIASIISIFFITTYGFINLSCAIESWASADFRPSFRIPTWVSALGAAACFLVMIEMDLLSFAGATLIMGLLYLFLKRRELRLEAGDTWEGVWASVIRSGLRYLSRGETHVRNWRPNIILFSGGTAARPHLIELGRWIVRTRGMLSNFDLVEAPEGQVLFARDEQAQPESDETIEGVFSRRLGCRDVYEGMESIAQVYGFSGVEPNTVLMGWGRNSRDPARFARLLDHFRTLDLNVLLLDYDRERGFGRQERIDIWWRGGSNNATLALAILKYLMISDEWQEAEARLLILLDSSPMVSRVRRNMDQLLEDQRLTATVKVINNAIDKAAFTDVIRRESGDADLTVIGVGAVDARNAADFIGGINGLVADIGSTLMVRASSFFEPLYVGIEAGGPVRQEPAADAVDSAEPQPVLAGYGSENNDRLEHVLGVRHQAVEAALAAYVESHLHSIGHLEATFLDELRDLVARSLTSVERRLAGEPGPRLGRLYSRVQADCLFHLHRHFEQFCREELPAARDHWEAALDQLRSSLAGVVDGTEDEVTVFHEQEAVAPARGDSLHLRLVKLWYRTRLRLLKRPIAIRVPYRRLVAHQVRTPLTQATYALAESLGIESYRLIAALQKWLRAVGDALGSLERRIATGDLAADEVASRREALIGQLTGVRQDHAQQLHGLGAALVAAHRRGMQAVYDEVLRLDVVRRVRRRYGDRSDGGRLDARLAAAPGQWLSNASLIVSYAIIELSLMVARHRMAVVLQKVTGDVQRHMQSGVLEPLAKLDAALAALEGSAGAEERSGLQAPLGAEDVVDTATVAEELLRGVQASIEELPEAVEIIVEESFQQLETHQYGQVETISIELRRLVNYVVETELVEPFQKGLADLVPHAQRERRAAGDIARLVRFSLENAKLQEDAEDASPQESVEAILATCRQRLGQERALIEAALAAFQDGNQKLLSRTFEKLDPYLLTRSAGNMGQYVRSQEGRRMILGFEVGRRRLRTLLSHLMVRLIYRRSEGVLLARRLQETAEPGPAGVGDTLGLVEALTPAPQVLSSLPLYYRQLFTGKQAIGDEYWVGRQEAMSRAAAAVRRHKQGHSGALLVVGNPDTGKASLCRRIAATHFEASCTYRLQPPQGGSADLAVFRSKLLEALGGAGDPREALASLPRDSVVLLENLEQWWERHPDGYAVVDEILQLLDEFSGHCLLVASINVHSFGFLSRARPLSRAFLDILECEPLDAKELQEAVLLRHRSTGLRFELDGRHEDQVTELALARFFSGLFEYSSGNVGFALHAWITCIEEVTGERLRLRRPDVPPLRILEHLGDEDLVWLRQFVLHRQLTPQRLARLFRIEPNEAARRAADLKRMGLLVEMQTGILETNPYVRPFLIQQLERGGML